MSTSTRRCLISSAGPGRAVKPCSTAFWCLKTTPCRKPCNKGKRSGPRFGEVSTLEQTSYPLTVGINLGETLSLHYGYALHSFCEPVIARLNAQLLHLLEQFSQSPQRPTGALDLLTADEWAQLRAGNSPQPYAVQPYVHERIAMQAPGSVALIVDGQHGHPTAQLDRRANRLAHALIAEGVGPEVPRCRGHAAWRATDGGTACCAQGGRRLCARWMRAIRRSVWPT